jgi:hypothetical protein
LREPFANPVRWIVARPVEILVQGLVKLTVSCPAILAPFGAVMALAERAIL